MKNLRVFAKPWFRMVSTSLVLGAVLLAILSFNLPATAEPPKPTVTPLRQVDVEYIDQNLPLGVETPKPFGLETPRPLEPGTDLLTPPPCDLHA